MKIADGLAATLVDSSPDGLLLVDGDGVIALANDAARELFGVPTGRLVGSSVDDLVPFERRDAHRRVRKQYAADPERRPMGTGLQLLAQHADGSLFPVEISLSPVEVDGSMYTIATVRDVSKRQADAAQLALLRDRERIARDLHDMVIQRLFGAGLGLQAVVDSARPAVVGERIVQIIDELDETIRQLRTAIFQLTVHEHDRTITEQVEHLVAERGRMLDAPPSLDIRGDLDELPGDIGEQLVATLGEALSNVARHADASSCTVSIHRDDLRLRLEVTDDGIGLPTAIERRGGLENMTYRAAVLGGSCTVGAGPAGGTVVDWTVPL